LLRRLVHVVVGSEEETSDPILGFFIEQTLLEVGNNQSLRKIVRGIQQVFLLNFSPPEITPALQKSVQAGRVVASQDSRYSLEARRADELRKQNSETRNFEDMIYSEWSALLTTKYPDLSDEDKKNLVADLRLYLNKVFLRHGAECAILIYPEETKLNALLERSSVETFDKELPKRSQKIFEIRAAEFPLFLRQLDNEKKVYFARILDGTFIYSLVQIDPSTQALVRDNFRNYKIYLDTNILYALFDLHNPQRTTTIEKTVNLATKTFNIKFVVSQHTVEEMKKSIASKKDLLLSSPPIKRELAEIGADISEDENVITSYWRAFHRTGISKEDYIEKLSHVPEMLAAKNISIEKTQGFADSVIEKEINALNAAIIPQRKSDNIARHDAYHKLLIQRVRKEAETKQTHQKFWFLSLDGLLLIYDLKTRGKGESPFMMFPHQLLQILRRFEQRTRDYDAAFFELFSRPQIKSAQGVLPTNLTQKVLAKMSGFEDLPPDIALSIILDQTFRKSVLEATDETALNQIIAEKTESVLATELKQHRERLEALELEKSKKGRTTEADAAQRKRDLAKKDGTITFYQTLSFMAFLALLIVFNILTYIYLWGHLNKILKALLTLVDTGLLIGVLRVRWQLTKSVAWAVGIIGVIGSILQIINQ